jgi:uncharacterized protein YbcV (DUF1398 family)
MNSTHTSSAQACLTAAYEGSQDFPSIVRTLMQAGFEGYTADYRRGTITYYLPDGESVELPTPKSQARVAAEFRADMVKAAIREAQSNAPGYSYRGFCDKVKAAGCAGYLVSFSGKRVLYFGRTAETHVEHFPQ